MGVGTTYPSWSPKWLPEALGLGLGMTQQPDGGIPVIPECDTHSTNRDRVTSQARPKTLEDWVTASSAAAHIDSGAGDVRGLLATKPCDGGRHLLWMSCPPERDLTGKPHGSVWLAAGSVDLGIDDAGPHSHHSDALCGHRFGQSKGHRVDGSFGCGIVHVLSRAAQPGGGR